jgi:hypothetical protein
MHVVISDIKFQQPLYLWLECCLSLWGPISSACTKLMNRKPRQIFTCGFVLNTYVKDRKTLFTSEQCSKEDFYFSLVP